MYTYKYTLGDWSDDGHGKTEVFFLESSHNKTCLFSAFERGQTKLGANVRELCEGYEESKISKEVAEIFIEAGMEFEDEIEDGIQYVTSEDYMNMIITTILVGDPNITLRYSGLEPEELCTLIDASGYGCFS